MVSQYWAYRREIAQNNGRTRPSDERDIQSERVSQIPILHQSQNNRSTTPHINQSEHENQIPTIHQSHTNCFTTPRNNQNERHNQISITHQSQNSHFTTPSNTQSEYGNQIPIIHQSQNSRFITLQNNQNERDNQIPITHHPQNSLFTTLRSNQNERENQIPIIHQSQNSFFTTPQSILQRSQHRPASLNNFPYVTVVNQQPHMTANNKQPHMGPYKITPYHASSIQQQPYAGPRKITPYHANSIQNSSPNSVGIQGFTNNFSNPTRPTFHNPKKFRFDPYGEGSSRMNNSSTFNDFNPRISINLNSLNVTKDDVIPITTPPSRHIIKTPPIFHPFTTRPHLSITSPISCNLFHDKEPKSYESDIRDIEAWKRKGKSFVSFDDCYEQVSNQEKMSLIFKDEKNVIPNRSIIETNEANKKDDESLDLSLHL
ncbi:uncharacterized protein LOC131619754 [Vicia villosa]|uniref:uncharacterized protein LOC131619754 n=1 Tax=Vicia villosa TaxID=3911 RepID=UPI00273CD1F0|nr:uncharacterized protein LOC131619754 [Vicia villosa]